MIGNWGSFLINIHEPDNKSVIRFVRLNASVCGVNVNYSSVWTGSSSPWSRSASGCWRRFPQDSHTGTRDILTHACSCHGPHTQNPWNNNRDASYWDCKAGICGVSFNQIIIQTCRYKHIHSLSCLAWFSLKTEFWIHGNLEFIHYGRFSWMGFVSWWKANKYLK